MNASYIEGMYSAKHHSEMKRSEIELGTANKILGISVMNNKTNSTSFQGIAMFCAIAGLVVNLLMISVSGVPISVPLGIFGIALATLCKDEYGKMTSKGRTALILSIVSLAFGFLIYYMTVLTTSTMADPVKSKMVFEALKSIKDQMPAEMQDMFRQAGIPLE